MTSMPDSGRSDLPGEWQRLALQLDALEAAGRRRLQTTQRREALDRALGWAFPAALGLPALWLLSGGRLAALWLPLVVASVLVPWLVGGAAYGLIRSRQHVSRGEALALLDQQLALKDRLTACAALLAAPQRNGFEQAALQEAAPWVAQALSQGAQPLPVAPLSALRRRGWCLPAALLMGIGAGWLPTRDAAVAAPPSVQEGRFSAGADLSASSPQAVRASGVPGTPTAPAPQTAPPDGAGVGALAFGDREPAGTAVAGAAALGGPGTGTSTAAAPRSPSGDAPPSPSAAAMAAADAAAGAAPPTGGLRREPGAQTPSPPQPGPRAEASPPGASQDDSQTSTSAGDARSRSQQEAPSQRGSQPPAAEKSSGSSQQGQPQNNSRSKGGNDGQNDGKGSGEGQNNGSRKGEEAGPKSGRGFATLMLARPMRDQVQGQTSPGPVVSVLQQGRPQGREGTSVQAAERGHLAGDAALPPPPALTASDRALLRHYFAREAQTPAPLASQPAPADTDLRARR